MQQEILFKEYVFPKTHSSAGAKIFRQTTKRNLRMLANSKADYAKAKAKSPNKKNNYIKEYSEPHEWSESPGPQSHGEVLMTTFTSNAVKRQFLAQYPPDGTAPEVVKKEVAPPPVILYPELDGADLSALIEFALKEFPEREAEINKSKYPNPLRENIRAWGKVKVATV